MTNNLAQRAAKELNVEGDLWGARSAGQPTMKTTMRLLARIDELEAQTKRRSEPMPEPVPEWVVIAAFAEFKKAFPFLYPDWQAWWRRTAEAVRIGYTRLIWERGDVEPVDPLYDALKEVVELGRYDTAEQTALLRDALASRGLEIVKRGMELAKEIG